MDISDPLDHFPLIASVRNRGIEYLSALQEITRSIQVSSSSGGQIHTSESHDWGTGFHFLHKENDVFLSINQNDAAGGKIFQLTDALVKKPTQVFPISQPIISFKNTIKSTIDYSNRKNNRNDNLEEEVDIIKNIENRITSFDPSIKYNIQLNIDYVVKNFQSSDSLDVTQKFTRDMLTIEIFSLQSTHKYNLREIIGGINGESTDFDIIEPKLKKILEDYNSMLHRPPISGKYKAVIHPDTTFSLIHESIGHGVEADQVISGNSFLIDKLGYPISSPLLNVTDDPNIKTLGWLVYDDEGVKSQGTQLIEEGILTNYLHNNQTAKYFETSSTGNARATSYLSPPEPRQTNLYIESGDMSLEEMLEEVKNGILIGQTDSASTSLYSGEYSINSQINYYIENGEISQILGPARITDHSLNTLNNISGMGKELTTIPSICLKGDSRVFIGGIAPYIVVDEIFVR